jgi:ADP-heptose:LPS heptosyltransferase
MANSECGPVETGQRRSCNHLPSSIRHSLFAIRNSVLLHAGALGDCVLALHVAAALRATVPGTRIEMAARCPLVAFAVGRGPIDAAINPDRIGLGYFYGDGELPAKAVQWIQTYDLVINLLDHERARVSTRLRAAARGTVLSVDPAWQRNGESRHITQQWLAALDGAGLTLRPPQEAVLKVPAAERESARRQLARSVGANADRFVVCHPGSGARIKCCPLEALEAVVGRLRIGGTGVVWMIGPTEMECHGRAYRDRLSRSAPVIGEESLPAAAGLLGGADTFVGNDAGMTHLAAALGLRTVALFGPTDPDIWRPLGERVAVVRFDSPDDGDSLAQAIAARIDHPS